MFQLSEQEYQKQAIINIYMHKYDVRLLDVLSADWQFFMFAPMKASTLDDRNNETKIKFESHVESFHRNLKAHQLVEGSRIIYHQMAADECCAAFQTCFGPIKSDRRDEQGWTLPCRTYVAFVDKLHCTPKVKGL